MDHDEMRSSHPLADLA